MSERVIDEEVLQFLKSMEFKKAMFGVDKQDVLEKMRKLNSIYARKLEEARLGNRNNHQEPQVAEAEQPTVEQVQPVAAPVQPVVAPIENNIVPMPTARVEYNSLEAIEYDKKINALAKVFVNSQTQAEAIVSQAKVQADSIIADAVKRADAIENESRIKAEQMKLKCKQDVEELNKQKEETLEYLRILKLFIGSYLDEDPGTASAEKAPGGGTLSGETA